jgi:hypothetical protein
MSEIDPIGQFLRLSLLVHTRQKIVYWSTHVIICFSNLCGVRNTEYEIEKTKCCSFQPKYGSIDRGAMYGRKPCSAERGALLNGLYSVSKGLRQGSSALPAVFASLADALLFGR